MKVSVVKNFLYSYTTGVASNLLRTDEGYSCIVCGKFFADPSNAKRHIKNTHSSVLHNVSCDICRRTYKNNDSLRDHQRKSHGLYKQ